MQWMILEPFNFYYLWLMLANTYSWCIYNKIEVLSKIFIREISNIPMVSYFSQIYIFNTALEIILRMIFQTINIYYYLTVPFYREHDNVVHSWIAYGKTNNLTYNMLMSVAKYGRYCHLSQHTRYHQIDKNTTTTVKRYVNELVPEPWVI